MLKPLSKEKKYSQFVQRFLLLVDDICALKYDVKGGSQNSHQINVSKFSHVQKGMGNESEMQLDE